MSTVPSRHGSFRHINKELLIVLALVMAAVLIIGAFAHNNVSGSPEVKFTDASKSGLAIVPASCPSDPHYAGDCSTSCDNNLDISQYPSCSCPAGQIQGGSTCSCPSGTTWNGTSCVSVSVPQQCGCPNGYTLNGSTCVPNSSQTFASSGTFYEPSDLPALTVTVNGAGGGGGGGALVILANYGCNLSSGANNGSSGGNSSFSSNLIANGGGAGQASGNCAAGAAGSSGSGSGGTVTAGGGGSGGSGGTPYTYGGFTYGFYGGAGGNGGKVVQTYASGLFSANQSIPIVVGQGGTGGTGDYDPYTGDGGVGGSGSVNVTWSTTLTNTPESCSCPTDYTLQNGSCTFSQCQNGFYSENGSCVSSCNTGYVQQGTSCVFSSCPQGYTQGTDQSGNPLCIYSGCPVGYVPQGNSCVFTSCPLGYTQSTDANNNPICTFTGCPNGYSLQGGQCLIFIPPAPQGDIVAAPSIVKSGSTSQISWSASNASSCSVTGTNGDGGAAWNCSGGACSATTTKTTSLLGGETTYTLACTGLDGSNFTRSATVNVAPKFNEQ